MKNEEIYTTIGRAAIMLTEEMKGRFIGMIGQDNNGKMILLLDPSVSPEEYSEILIGLGNALNEMVKTESALNNQLKTGSINKDPSSN
jgi:hypothetical protein